MNRIGTDLIEVSRVRDSIERSGEAFLNRIYTEGERRYCDGQGAHRFESYAARFAAKEAFSKALGTGICGPVSFCEIEVCNEPSGRPILRLSGSTASYFEFCFPGASVEVSLAHIASCAMASVLITE